MMGAQPHRSLARWCPASSDENVRDPRRVRTAYEVPISPGITSMRRMSLNETVRSIATVRTVSPVSLTMNARRL